MHIIDPQLLGGGMLLTLAVLVAAKRLTTGSLFERLAGSGLLWLANGYNLGFLLIANPVAAVLLATRQSGALAVGQIAVPDVRLLAAIEGVGLAFYALGAGLMLWSLAQLGRNYQLGGIAPRRTDALVVNGPYRFVRHPLYAAVLCLSLGLVCLLQSAIYLAIFGVYVALIGCLIPREEAGLASAYGDAYVAYRHTVKAVVPFII